MKPSELRDLTVEDLNTRLKDLREELFRLRFQATTGQLDNPIRKRQARREIARVLTILRQKEAGSRSPAA